MDEDVNMLAQVQAEAVATWRSPQNRKPTVRGVERLRAWCEGLSLHAGVALHKTDEWLLVDGERRWDPHPRAGGSRHPLVCVDGGA